MPSPHRPTTAATGLHTQRLTLLSPGGTPVPRADAPVAGSCLRIAPQAAAALEECLLRTYAHYRPVPVRANVTIKSRASAYSGRFEAAANCPPRRSGACGFAIQMYLHFLIDLLTIVFIDLVLSGDNGVVIALAVKALPQELRLRAIAAGAGFAVVLRVAATFFAGALLHLKFVQLIGGIVILWISVNLFRDAAAAEAPAGRSPGFWKAIWIVIIADITMSTDNILAIAAVAKGNLALLIIGFGLSIPFVVFASSLLARLMDRYRFIVYLGAAILGNVGAEMILNDPFVAHAIRPTLLWRNSAEAAAAIGVLVAGRLFLARSSRASDRPAAVSATDPRPNPLPRRDRGLAEPRP